MKSWKNSKNNFLRELKTFDGTFVSFQQFIDNIQSITKDIDKPEEVTEILQFTLQHLITPSIYTELKTADTSDFEKFKKSIETILFGQKCG